MSRCTVYDVQYSTQLVLFVVLHLCMVVQLILSHFLQGCLSGFEVNRSWIYLLLYVAVFITWNDVQVLFTIKL